MVEIQFATVGKGATVHGTRVGVTTLCSKRVGALVTAPETVITCKACIALAAKLNPNTEETKMAATNETAAPEVDQTEAAKADLENLILEFAKLNKDDNDKITALEAQATAELVRIKSANKRAPFSMRVKEAVRNAKNRKPNTGIAVRIATDDVTKIAGYGEIVDNAATKIAEGIKSEVGAQETGRIVAEAILDARLRIFNKQGDPDLKGTRQASKEFSSNVYTAAAQKLHAEGWNPDGKADYETLEAGLKDKVQYQMTAVLPAFVYSLDNSPEAFAELFPALVKDVDAETKASDLVFSLYGINRKSKAELAADRRAAAKALEGGATAEGAGEGEAEGEGGDTAEAAAGDKTQYEKDTAKLDRMVKDLPTIVTHAEEYSDDQKDALRKKLSDALTKLSEALAKL